MIQSKIIVENATNDLNLLSPSTKILTEMLTIKAKNYDIK